MKRKVLSILLAISVMGGIVGCGQTAEDATTEPTSENVSEDGASDETEKEVPELSVIRWNSGTSGNVLLTIAEKMGYFEEYGITIEEVSATANADAMALLSTGQVDIVSNAGTSNPLQQIASGVDIVSFGGHMMTGCMPVVALKGTVWNGPEDLIGKKFACNPSYFAFTGAVMNLGYDNPLEAVDWVTYTNYNDALAAVVRGEVDYALMGTGQNFMVQNMDEVEIMTYQNEIMPNYSCCRMVASREFLADNPITTKIILKVLLRAQSYYEANKDEAVTLHAAKIGTEEDYVAAYMLNQHYQVSVDPLKNSVVRAWGILDDTGFLNENAKAINILDHINTELYEQALNEASTEFGDEDKEFYNRMLEFFEANNS